MNEVGQRNEVDQADQLRRLLDEKSVSSPSKFFERSKNSVHHHVASNRKDEDFPIARTESNSSLSTPANNNNKEEFSRPPLPTRKHADSCSTADRKPGIMHRRLVDPSFTNVPNRPLGVNPRISKAPSLRQLKTVRPHTATASSQPQFTEKSKNDSEEEINERTHLSIQFTREETEFQKDEIHRIRKEYDELRAQRLLKNKQLIDLHDMMEKQYSRQEMEKEALQRKSIKLASFDAFREQLKDMKETLCTKEQYIQSLALMHDRLEKQTFCIAAFTNPWEKRLLASQKEKDMMDTQMHAITKDTAFLQAQKIQLQNQLKRNQAEHSRYINRLQIESEERRHIAERREKEDVQRGFQVNFVRNPSPKKSKKRQVKEKVVQTLTHLHLTQRLQKETQLLHQSDVHLKLLMDATGESNIRAIVDRFHALGETEKQLENQRQETDQRLFLIEKKKKDLQIISTECKLSEMDQQSKLRRDRDSLEDQLYQFEHDEHLVQERYQHLYRIFATLKQGITHINQLLTHCGIPQDQNTYDHYTNDRLNQDKSSVSKSFVAVMAWDCIKRIDQLFQMPQQYTLAAIEEKIWNAKRHLPDGDRVNTYLDTLDVNGSEDEADDKGISERSIPSSIIEKRNEHESQDPTDSQTDKEFILHHRQIVPSADDIKTRQIQVVQRFDAALKGYTKHFFKSLEKTEIEGIRSLNDIEQEQLYFQALQQSREYYRTHAPHDVTNRRRKHAQDVARQQGYFNFNEQDSTSTVTTKLKTNSTREKDARSSSPAKKRSFHLLTNLRALGIGPSNALLTLSNAPLKKQRNPLFFLPSDPGRHQGKGSSRLGREKETSPAK